MRSRLLAKPRATLACAAALLVLAATPHALAQSGPHWSSRFMPPGANGPITSWATFDGALVIAGQFSTVSGEKTGAVARWDGGAWRALGPIEGVGVERMAVWGNDLVVSTWPLDRSSSRQTTYRWDGRTWQPLGTGFQGRVRAFATCGGELFAAWQAEVDWHLESRLSRWTGSEWAPIDLEPGLWIEAVAVFRDRLVLAGAVPSDSGKSELSVCALDGTTWQDIAGVSGSCWSMVSAGGQLLLWGRLSFPGETSSHELVCWDGSQWQDMGGLPPSLYGSLVSDGADRSFFVGEKIWQWDGHAWLALPPTEGGGWLVGVIRVGSDLFAVGSFDVLRLQGETWKAVSPGCGPWGYALTSAGYRGSLLLGGGLCSSRDVATVVRWNGTRFAPLTSDVAGVCGAFAEWNGDLYAGGRLWRDEETDSGSASPERAVLGMRATDFDGTAPRWDETGELQGTAYALIAHGGALYAGGAFGDFWGDDAANVQRWDGTSWTPQGGIFDDDVFAFATYGGALIAGGRFSSIDGASVRHVARWDGSAWRELGGGIDGDVNTLLVHDGRLFAGGRFERAGAVVAHSVAVWDGTAWTAVGEDPITGRVWKLAEYNGTVVAGGSMRLTLAADTTLGIARWDGRRWRSMDGGVPGSVQGLTVWGSHLIVAGRLDLESGYEPPAAAVWEDVPGQSADGGSPTLSLPGATPVITSARADEAFVRLSIYVPRQAEVQLDIVDARGARVAELAHGVTGAGHFSFDWPLTAAAGRRAASGIYWARLAAEGLVSARRVVLVR